MQQLLAAFLAAHLAGDFLLQTDRDIAHKARPAVLAKHGVVHGLLVLLLTGSGAAWLPALAIASAHVAIDFGKQRLSSAGWKAFLIDQLLHVVVLLTAAWVWIRFGFPGTSIWADLFGGVYFQTLAVLGGLVATVTAGAYFIDLAVDPFLAQLRADGSGPSADREGAGRFEAVERSAGARLRGLRDGGRTIGQLERALIFIFVLVDQFSAIGFLIAAKSVFRFGELRERSNRMEAEYIIIGTLISFLWAIVTALLTRLLAGL